MKKFFLIIAIIVTAVPSFAQQVTTYAKDRAVFYNYNSPAPAQEAVSVSPCTVASAVLSVPNTDTTIVGVPSTCVRVMTHAQTAVFYGFGPGLGTTAGIPLASGSVVTFVGTPAELASLTFISVATGDVINHFFTK